jgi:DNA-directed RNA polymerase specialized sigma24 family protein
VDSLLKAQRAREHSEAAWEHYIEAVLTAHREGHTMREIAAAVGLSPTAVHKMIRRYSER